MTPNTTSSSTRVKPCFVSLSLALFTAVPFLAQLQPEAQKSQDKFEVHFQGGGSVRLA